MIGKELKKCIKVEGTHYNFDCYHINCKQCPFFSFLYEYDCNVLYLHFDFQKMLTVDIDSVEITNEYLEKNFKL